MALLKNQAFTLALLLACLAAFLFPEAGATEGILHSQTSTKIAVAIAFFLQGLNLQPQQLFKSATRLRVMLFCQSWNFALAPALMLIFMIVAGDWIHPGLKMGMLYLSVLPTTISSAIILTDSFGGDSATSLFNATLSNLIGVFLTPIWCVALFGETSQYFPPITSLIAKISLLVILPIIVAQFLRPSIFHIIENRRHWIKITSNAMIVFIVYVSFCNSVESGIWSSLSSQSVTLATILVVAYLLLVSSLAWTSSAIADPENDQRIAAFFCSSQKTLAAGAPMAALIFANHSAADQGLIILPLILYHSLQLFLAGIVGPRLAKEA